MEGNETISKLREAETAFIKLFEETNEIVSERIGQKFAQTIGGGVLLSTTNSEVLTATERFADTLAETKAESDSDEFVSILIECNEELKQELGVDYGAVCSDDDCC